MVVFSPPPSPTRLGYVRSVHIYLAICTKYLFVVWGHTILTTCRHSFFLRPSFCTVIMQTTLIIYFLIKNLEYSLPVPLNQSVYSFAPADMIPFLIHYTETMFLFFLLWHLNLCYHRNDEFCMPCELNYSRWLPRGELFSFLVSIYKVVIYLTN